MKLFDIAEPNEVKTQEEDSLVVGIDLGTTNSIIASYNGQDFNFYVSDITNTPLVPSCINIKDNVNVIGDIESAEIRSFKRIMGKNKKQIHEELSEFMGIEYDGLKPFLKLGDQKISPEEASALVLEELKKIASQVEKRAVKKAVITVPAYFNEDARQATKDAAQIAGIEVLRLLNEPTAAAIAYGLDNLENGNFVIYDLGGGTFDISVLKLKNGVFKISAVGGDSNLGGDDFDMLIMNHIASKFNLEKSTKLLKFSKMLKEKLSDVEEVVTEFNGAHITLSATEIKDICMPLVIKTLRILDETISSSKVDYADFNNLILVGGATRLPSIKKELSRLFAGKILSNIDPDLVVAMGAALQAYNLTNNSGGLLLDVLPISIGIEVADEMVEKVFFRNSQIPNNANMTFTTQKDGQTGFIIHLLQGEGTHVSKMHSIGKYELKGIPPMQAGDARLDISFQIDADGLLSLTAKERISGAALEVEVKPTNGLSQTQILEIIKKSIGTN